MNNTNLEFDPGKIKIINKTPTLLDQPELIESVLLPIELFSLNVVLERKAPVSTNQLHDITVKKVWLDAIKEKRSSTHSLLGDPALNGPMSHRILRPEDNSTFSNTEMGIIRKELKKQGIKYPSYDKIDSVLEGLESWGILTRRYEGTGRAKYFWIVQPGFSIDLRNKMLKYFNSKKEEVLSW